MLFLKKVWDWLKKYWYWILFPIGILVFLGKMFLRGKSSTVIIENKNPTAAADIALHDNQTAAKVQEAEKATAEEIKNIEERHQEALDKLNASQRLQYEELKKKPAHEITNWLLRVGRGDA